MYNSNYVVQGLHRGTDSGVLVIALVYDFVNLQTA